jgi:hypothetical protein
VGKVPLYTVCDVSALGHGKAMAMLKTNKETHTRFMNYIAKRFIQTEHNMTVTEALNELLDCGDELLMKQRNANDRFDHMPEDELKHRIEHTRRELSDQK